MVKKSPPLPPKSPPAAKKPAQAALPPPLPEKRKGGTPPFVPTQDQRLLVMLAKSGGFTDEQIAGIINMPFGISTDTLTKYFRRELDTGADSVNLKVMTNLFAMATSQTHPGATSAAIFWMKARLKWSTGDGASFKLERGGGPNGEPPVSFTLRIGDGPIDESKLS